MQHPLEYCPASSDNCYHACHSLFKISSLPSTWKCVFHEIWSDPICAQVPAVLLFPSIRDNAANYSRTVGAGWTRIVLVSKKVKVQSAFSSELKENVLENKINCINWRLSLERNIYQLRMGGGLLLVASESIKYAVISWCFSILKQI